MRKQMVAGLWVALVVLGLSAAGVILWLTVSSPDPEPVCCAAPSTSNVPAAGDGSGLRRNNSPSPAPTAESVVPRITLPHIPWPKHEPDAAGEHR